jgi:hypothetical protein
MDQRTYLLRAEKWRVESDPAGASSDYPLDLSAASLFIVIGLDRIGLTI